MKIAKVEIYNYKSIGEKCVIDFDEKSTTLVGKSNVGKTNILEAIEFAFTDDHPKDEYKCSWNNKEPLCVKILLKIEKKDVPQIGKLNPSFAKLNFITMNRYVNGEIEFNGEPEIPVEKWYEPSDYVIESLTNFRAKTRRIIRDLSGIKNTLDENDALKMNLSKLDTFVNSDKKLNPMQSEDEQKSVITELLLPLGIIRKELNRSKFRNINTRGIKRKLTNIVQDLNDFLPDIEYHEIIESPFTDETIYDLLPDVIYLKSNDELKINEEIFVDDIRKTNNDNFMRGLIDLSEIDIDILEKGTRREIEDHLNEKNRVIADRLSRYWNQENLQIELKQGIDPNNPRRKIELDFIGGANRRSSISDQSPGTRWFMAFIVEYLATQSDNGDIILLLDEPGIMLHAGAQKDLLERFEDTDQSIQIIYTTHSPYMINKNFPLRIRCVEKGNGIDTIRGTYVNQKPYASPKCRAWEPIRSSIGLSLGDSLFVGGNNLIVEGVSDPIIISSVIQVLNTLEKKTKFDLNKVSITFAGNYANLLALATFCHQETESTKVILDGDTGLRNQKNLAKAHFPKDRIFIINEVLDKTKNDIESLFNPDYYHECVLEAYKELEPLNIYSKLPKTWAEIEKEVSEKFENKTDKWGHSKFYTEYFKNKKDTKDDIGGFDKVLVAKKLSDKLISADELKQKEIVKPFEKLIAKIWQQKPNWF